MSGNKQQLDDLKFILSTYLVLEHLLHGLDLRYDSFLASILKNRIDDFAEEIKIVSWNYDYQLEYSYAGICGETDFATVRQKMNDVKYDPETSHGDCFKTIKLNGTIGTYVNDAGKEEELLETIRFSISSREDNIIYRPATVSNPNRDYVFKIDNIDNYNKVLDRYVSLSRLRGRAASSLKFAWETVNNTPTEIKKHAELIADTDILVVVGYSFPFFNREVDRQLFGPSNMRRLSKIYIQDKYPDRIRQRLKSVRSDEPKFHTELVDDVDQFFIPYEM